MPHPDLEDDLEEQTGQEADRLAERAPMHGVEMCFINDDEAQRPSLVALQNCSAEVALFDKALRGAEQEHGGRRGLGEVDHPRYQSLPYELLGQVIDVMAPRLTRASGRLD